MAATAADSKTLPIQSKEIAQSIAASSSSSSAETTTNPRGIPSFPFLANVSDYVKSTSETEGVLTRFQEMISKYQFMQTNVERRAAGLREKLPEMTRTLDVVKFLRQKKTKLAGKASTAADTDEDKDEDELDEDEDEDETDPPSKDIQTTFQLQDTLYAHASIDASSLDEVYLWLGANVMVAYPLAEAQTLLESKVSKAQESLKFAEEDLEFLRIQVTTLEVATARVHNWDVGEKRRLKALGQSTPSGSSRKDQDDDDDDDNTTK